MGRIMNAWMGSMAELMNLRHAGFDSSFADVRALLPGAESCAVLVLYAAFCLLWAWEDTVLDARQGRESDTDRE